MKVRELIEMLKVYNQEQEITNEQNQPFVHIRSTQDGDTILSTTEPIGVCKRTGMQVYPSVVDGYLAFSPELDEDLFGIEFTKTENNERE